MKNTPFRHKPGCARRYPDEERCQCWSPFGMIVSPFPNRATRRRMAALAKKVENNG